MRHFPSLPLFHVLTVVCVVISLISTSVYARPRDLQTVSNLPGLDNPPPNHLSHSTNALAVVPQHQRRGPTTYYNNLAPWKVVVAATAFFWNSANQVAIPATDIANLWATIAADAAAAVSSNYRTDTKYEWGQGAVQVVFTVRMGTGSSATIPWSLVAQLAMEFQQEALRGNAGAFRAQVNGPLGKNVVGGLPYIEVILALGKRTVIAGLDEAVNWGII